jgi:UPF0755 protein
MTSALYWPELTSQHSYMRNKIGIALLLVLLGGGFFAWGWLKPIYFSGVPGTLADPYLLVPTGTDLEGLVRILQRNGFISDEQAFRFTAQQMKFQNVRAGRFEIKAGWHNRDLIQHLRLGKQSPVKVVLNTERLPENIAGKVGRLIESDSLRLLKAFNDPALLSEIGATPETFIANFIPNTYELYWNTSPEDFVRRMVKEAQIFWSKNDRLTKAQALNLTPTQVYTMASIVERESNYNPERPTIAGVYLNRLRIDMRLQADPTCVFATRDFGARRVTQYHTTFNSPYNTYIYKGLPPGPISMASIPSIDAVLNHEKHNYLYFCAKPDNAGTHAFAATLQAHNVNAQKFYAWMRQQGR